MKLNSSDRELLKSWGHAESDLPQIEEAMQARNTVYCMDGQRISRKRAIEVLGREEYLSGISRSAFHATAERKTPDGAHTVSFDSYRLYR